MSRTYIKEVKNSAYILRKFARGISLEVVLKHIPDIHPVVIEYLETGDESIRSAAWGAAWSAAECAAWSASSVNIGMYCFMA